MKYEAKSIIIGRKKRAEGEEYCPCFVALFSVNKPHKGGKVPDQILDYREVRKISVKGLDFEYQLEGSDIVIENLSELKIDKVSEGSCNILKITGKQN
ncbi:hypothetical protein COV16_05525 [Candidatus Woesearchaeota archaeon CG10_big_fil_rev_8_21_14_0_10_34_8]|nr:MAG: hypothetical protein COV16_05525 [Candidatus Woesearchaeota archaeon CG10_big_fil_rev_8_21_14_0_10_34_8]